jgi:hypothetical protein
MRRCERRQGNKRAPVHALIFDGPLSRTSDCWGDDAGGSGNGAVQLHSELASIMITNSLDSDASCLVTCKFATTKFDNNPQITCAKRVPAGKEVEMCRLTSGGDKMVKLTEGRAECTK